VIVFWKRNGVAYSFGWVPNQKLWNSGWRVGLCWHRFWIYILRYTKESEEGRQVE
jgi:hypothetical protein